jgi:hypothetical protein
MDFMVSFLFIVITLTVSERHVRTVYSSCWLAWEDKPAEVFDDIVRDPAVSGRTIQTAIHVGDSLAASG